MLIPFAVRGMFHKDKNQVQVSPFPIPSTPISSEILLPHPIYSLWCPSPWTECDLKASTTDVPALDSSTHPRKAGKGLKAFINSKIKLPDLMAVSTKGGEHIEQPRKILECVGKTQVWYTTCQLCQCKQLTPSTYEAEVRIRSQVVDQFGLQREF